MDQMILTVAPAQQGDDRTRSHSEKLEEFRAATRADFDEVRAYVSSVRRDVAEIKQILTEAKLPGLEQVDTMDGAARRAAELAAG